MRSSRLWALIVIVLLVAVNVWVFYPTQDEPRSLAEAVRAFTEKERRTWADSEVVPLDNAPLETLIENLESANCLNLPKDAVPVSAAELGDDARRDLAVAVAGLCRAYRIDTAKAVVDYMHERGETMGPVNSEQLRQSLQKEGIDVLRGGADEELRLAEAIRTAIGKGAHWESLRPGGSCWRVYRVSQYDDKKPTSPGTGETTMWGGSSGFRHRFTPKYTIQDELRSTGALLLCDAKLVIDHDASLRGATVPYYIRFWRSTADNRWHPIALTSMPKDLARMRLQAYLQF